MNKSGLRLIIIMASLWAIFCGGFAYDVVQREKKALYQSITKENDRVGQGETRPFPLGLRTEEQKKTALKAYHKDLLELYCIFAPFLWVSLTLSGYIVAAGFLLPVYWIGRWVKQCGHRR